MVQILEPRPSFGSQLGQALGLGLGSGIAKGTEFAQKLGLERAKTLGKSPSREAIKESLVSQGISPEDAEFYANLTTGGKTAYAKELLEEKKRGGGILKYPEDEQKVSISPEMQEESEFTEALKEQDLGLTPAEKVRRGGERYKTGLPIVKEAHEKLQSFSDNKRRLNVLEDLSNSKKLPSYLGRLNVNAEGNLKLPFLSSAEAQRFVKTINEFAAGAKGTYGARVTNFDLAQYLKQFPSLLNSHEGIKQLIQQIKIVNEINSVYYKNLQNVFEKSGGARNIDSDIAISRAEKLSEKKVEELGKKFSQIGLSDSLPPAHKNKGEQFQDEETGDIYVSDGRSWIKQS